MFKKFGVITATALVMVVSTAANAGIMPTSYDMKNGSSWYLDKKYNGSGNASQAGALLSGGLGDLTDGIIPKLNYHHVESSDLTGPNVGWMADPVITFHFDGSVAIDNITIYTEDYNGFASVRSPRAVRFSMGTYSKTFSVPDDIDAIPDTLTFTDLNFTGDTLNVTLFRNSLWVLVSEITFDSKQFVTPVPEPAAIGLLGAGLAATALVRRRRYSR